VVKYGNGPDLVGACQGCAKFSKCSILELAFFRSCVSRAYYAAYSKIAHELVVTAQLSMPLQREGPSHTRIRKLIATSMPNLDDDKRLNLSGLLGRLYDLRINADYEPSLVAEDREAREAISMMKTVFESF
jgi:uncharacterized protein (UPF0332 family)